MTVRFGWLGNAVKASNFETKSTLICLLAAEICWQITVTKITSDPPPFFCDGKTFFSHFDLKDICIFYTSNVLSSQMAKINNFVYPIKLAKPIWSPSRFALNTMFQISLEGSERKSERFRFYWSFPFKI